MDGGQANKLRPQAGRAPLRVDDVQMHVRFGAEVDLVGGAEADGRSSSSQTTPYSDRSAGLGNRQQRQPWFVNAAVCIWTSASMMGAWRPPANVSAISWQPAAPTASARGEAWVVPRDPRYGGRDAA